MEHNMEGKEENSPEWMRQQLEIQLSLLIKKYWCGQYQTLHPKVFKQVLGAVHPQLNGFRQVNHLYSFIINSTRVVNLVLKMI